VERPKQPRNLANFTDVCKWKPRELNTFDLLYENGEFYSGAQRGGLEVFKPSVGGPDNVLQNGSTQPLFWLRRFWTSCFDNNVCL